uniref:CGG triplet repeat-binding protein 1 n=1 Tax=Schizaphis graminum TaxID=13262 RepID=A0A2S2PQT6_SCHGA
MPKITNNTRIRQYITEFGEKVFSSDGTILFCKFCETKINTDRRYLVTQHLKTEKHKSAEKRKQDQMKKKSQQLVGTAMTSKKSSFNHDLCNTLLSANIPLNKLNNPKFREFLLKYTGKDIPFESTLRKGYIDDVYNQTLNKIRTGRFVANVIIGTLEEHGPGQIFLLNVEELEKANHSTIFKLFDKSMNILWPDGVKHDDVLLFLSDAAPYMVKSASSIKTLYSKMIHTTCLAHGLHRVAETVRILNPKVDKIIANVKKIFKKAPSRVQIFKDIAPLLPLPPEPILTRWGTWIQAALYYCEHFETVKSIVNSFKKDDAISIETAQKYIEQQHIQTQLVFIKSNFSFLPNAITCLEKQGMSLASSISIVEDAKIKLTQINGAQGTAVKTKIETVLGKNEGYKLMVKISNILSGDRENFEGLPEDLKLNDLVYFKYAPITSVDVERSFSIYKNMLTNNRRAFKFDNIRKCLIVQSNFTGKQFIILIFNNNLIH